jgi:hypothetical protein
MREEFQMVGFDCDALSFHVGANETLTLITPTGTTLATWQGGESGQLVQYRSGKDASLPPGRYTLRIS